MRKKKFQHGPRQQPSILWSLKSTHMGEVAPHRGEWAYIQELWYFFCCDSAMLLSCACLCKWCLSSFDCMYWSINRWRIFERKASFATTWSKKGGLLISKVSEITVILFLEAYTYIFLYFALHKLSLAVEVFTIVYQAIPWSGVSVHILYCVSCCFLIISKLSKCVQLSFQEAGRGWVYLLWIIW